MTAAVAPLSDAFDVLKSAFDIPDAFEFDLRSVHPAPEDLSSVRATAAFTMRRIQLLVHLAQPDTFTRMGTMMSLTEMLAAQMEQLQRQPQCSAADRHVIHLALLAMDDATRSLTELSAQHGEALGGRLDVELGPSVVPDTPKGLT